MKPNESPGTGVPISLPEKAAQPESTDRASAESLITALQAWADEHPEAIAAAVEEQTPDSAALADGLMWRVASLPGSECATGNFMREIDIAAPQGTRVVAAEAGTVTYAGDIDGFGRTVVLHHPGGVSTLYGHLSAITVRKHQDLEAGDVLGAVGCTGDCEGPHLHFEVRVEGVAVDPLDYLPGGVILEPAPEPEPERRGGWGGWRRW